MLALLNFLNLSIQSRLSQYFNVESPYPTIDDVPLPDLSTASDPLSIFIKTNALKRDEWVALLVAFVPHVQPDFFDTIMHTFFDKPTDFPQIGGVRGKQFRGFLPTGETVLFILAGDDWVKRFKVQHLFSEAHLFSKKQVLWIEEPIESEPLMSGKLKMSTEFVELFTMGKLSKPRFTTSFPAECLETGMTWDDLVLPSTTHQEVGELLIWLRHGETLLHDWGMSRIVKPGYRALFHGPPGTGKTLTAALLGKLTGRDVFRIDLSMIISKFIGETEKNLAQLFDRAENKDWILFFVETRLNQSW